MAVEEKFEMIKKAISSDQNVEVYSDYYAQDEKLVLRIEIKKPMKNFLTYKKT